MSIERNGRAQQMVCDNCSDTGEEFDRDDFALMIAREQRHGWTIRKVRDEWEHYCPNCKPKDSLTANQEFKRQ